MNGLGGYLKNIFETVTTIFEGMAGAKSCEGLRALDFESKVGSFQGSSETKQR